MRKRTLFIFLLLSTFLLQESIAQFPVSAIGGKDWVTCFYSVKINADAIVDFELLNTNDSLHKIEPFFFRKSLQDIFYRIDCTIQISAKRKLNDSIQCLVRIKFNKFESGLKQNEIESNSIVSEISDFLLANVSPKGGIADLILNGNVSQFSEKVLKDILSYFPFKKIETGGQQHETDSYGTYVCKYSNRQLNSQGLSIKKNKLYYIDENHLTPNKNVKVNSLATYLFDTTQKFIELTQNEDIISLIKTDTFSYSRSIVTISLQNYTSSHQENLDSILTSLSASNLLNRISFSKPSVTKGSIRMSFFKEKIKNSDFDQLLQQVDTVSKELLPELLEKMIAFCYVYPSNSFRVADKLLAGGITDRQSNIFQQVLSFTHTDESTDAIAYLINAKKSNEKLLLQLIMSLTTTENPTDESIQTLKKLINDKKNFANITSTAQLSLGAFVNKYNFKDSAIANSILNFLLDSVNYFNDTIQYLKVLGNCCSSILFNKIKSVFYDQNASLDVKIQAIEALTMNHSKEVVSFLQIIQQNNYPSEITNAASESLSEREKYYKSF